VTTRKRYLKFWKNLIWTCILYHDMGIYIYIYIYIYMRIYKHFALEYLSDEKDLCERSEERHLPTRMATRVSRLKTADGLWRNFLNINNFGILQFSEFSTPIRSGQVCVKPATHYFKWGARVDALRNMSLNFASFRSEWKTMLYMWFQSMKPRKWYTNRNSKDIPQTGAIQRQHENKTYNKM
jgi:hypothetical protein